MTHRPRPRAPVQTLDRQTPHERSIQSHNFTPSALRKRLPKSRTELDVLVEHHKFIREVRQDREGGTGEEKLSWEDELAEKFYETLFREFAVVNLKHYKSHQIALRWRNEEEVLSSIGQRTCGHLRCRYHLPPPPTTPSTAQIDDDEEDESPLVETRLYTFQVPFGYVEEGVKKGALVKLVLCKECGKKLNYGRGKKGDSEESKGVDQGAMDGIGEGEDDYAPSRPPDLEREDRDDNPGSSSRRRSASPPPRRQRI